MPRVRRTKQHTHDEPSAAESGLPRAIWSGTLSFGLVTIPVELYSATRSTRRSLRMLAPDGTPLSRRYFSADGKVLDNDQLERGYPLDDGSFVVVQDEELERLLPDQSRDIDLTRFVPKDAIPPLYFERAYILAPAGGSSSAYRLLSSTMERLEKVGIATFVMRDRQYIIAISARDGLLRAETLRFADELRTPKSVGLPEVSEASAARVKSMRTAIKNLSKPQVVEKELSDSYWQRLEKLVEKKRAKDEDVVAADKDSAQGMDESGAEIIDLMAVLRASLAQQKPANSNKTSATKRSAQKRPGVKKARTTATKRTRKAS